MGLIYTATYANIFVGNFIYVPFFKKYFHYVTQDAFVVYSQYRQVTKTS